MSFAQLAMSSRSSQDLEVRLACLPYVPRDIIELQSPSYSGYSSERSNTIWQYWNQGIEHAPTILKSCVASVALHCKRTGHEHIVLSDETVADCVRLADVVKAKRSLMTPTHFSDLLRLTLLSQRGGYWLDSSLFLTGPIPDVIDQADFFAFTRISDPYLLSSWFLRARAGHALIETWLQALLNYWQHNDRLMNYFLIHHMFEAVTEVHPSLRRIWLDSPVASSPDAHLLHDSLELSCAQVDLDTILSKSSIHKLTYQLNREARPSPDVRLFEAIELLYPCLQPSTGPDIYSFSKQDPGVWNGIHTLSELSRDLPQARRLELFSTVSRFVPGLEPTTFTEAPKQVRAQQGNTTIHFPNPIPIVKLAHVVCCYTDLLRRKYTLDGFVEVQDGDVVVDCGAFVGGFSLFAVERAKHVYAFEPDPGNAACARSNLARYSNATLLEIGLSDTSGIRHLNLSHSAVEHSYLAPDAESSDISIPTQVARLDEFCASHAVPAIDFLKLEAEGFEVEVFNGLGALRPKQIAIDVSPERGGSSPVAYFRETLANLGYEVRVRGNVLFARSMRGA